MVDFHDIAHGAGDGERTVRQGDTHGEIHW
jgi:hypothetical protein